MASVLFVPQTTNGDLAKALRKEMHSLAPTLGWKFRVVEKAGVSVKDKLTKSNPWSKEMCRDANCEPCLLSEKPLECRKRNIQHVKLFRKMNPDPTLCMWVSQPGAVERGCQSMLMTIRSR